MWNPSGYLSPCLYYTHLSTVHLGYSQTEKGKLLRKVILHSHQQQSVIISCHHGTAENPPKRFFSVQWLVIWKWWFEKCDQFQNMISCFFYKPSTVRLRSRFSRIRWHLSFIMWLMQIKMKIPTLTLPWTDEGDPGALLFNHSFWRMHWMVDWRAQNE